MITQRNILIQMRLILLLLHLHLIITQVTDFFQALNSTCIEKQYMIPSTNTSSKNFIQMKIPALSQAIIQIDLRHLESFQQLNNVYLAVIIRNTKKNEQSEQILEISVSTTQYILFAANQLIITAYFSIYDVSESAVLSKSYLFSQSVSVKIVPANPQQKSQQKSFLFVVANTDQISLPYNMISNEDANNFKGYFLTKDYPLSELKSRQTAIPSYSDYWNGLQSVALPYIPYLSNCENKGDYLFFSQLIHNSSYCKLYGNNISPINQFSFGSSAYADTCNFTTKCVYDEIKDTSNQYSFWNTLNTIDTVLFSITALQSSSINILNRYESTELVPCKLKTTSGTGSANMFPMKVSINLGYYQETQTERRMINCEVDYSLYSQSKENFVYQLNINLSPLSHTSILLNFGFDWYVYMLVFIIIGLVSNFQFLIFWCYHLVVTIKSKRTLNLKMYLRLQKQILKGVIPAGFITFFFTFMIEIVMNGTFFGKPIFDTFGFSFWDYILAYDYGNQASTYKENSQSGRMGFSYLVVASCMMIYLSDYLIGKQRKKSEYQQYEIMGRRFKPKTWKRGKLLFSSLMYIFMCVYFLYFTYTSVFNNNIWLIIAFMQIFQMILQQVIYSIFEDQLPCLPLKLTVGVMAYLGTMGAIDLYYFILGYLVDVGISIIEITYLSQLQEGITNFIQRKIEEFNKFYYNLLNDEDQDQQDKSHAGQTQVENVSIMIEKNSQEIDFLEKQIEQQQNLTSFEEIRIYDNEKEIGQKYFTFISQKRDKYQNKQHNDKNKQKTGYLKKQQQQQFQKQFQNKKFQLIVDGTSGMIQYLIQPIIVLFLWITYETSTILSNFQISSQNCILYLLSSLILAFFFQINIIIIFHVLQLYLNTDYRKLVLELLDNFKNKKTFWITDLDQINNALQIKLRGLYSYSISSQMFFVITLYTLSMYFFIVGCTTIIQSQYNIFKDPFLIFIFLFWIFFFQISQTLLKKLAKLLNIWGYSDFSKQKQSQTRIQQFSSFDNQTNEIMRRQQMFNHSSIKFTFKHLSKQFIQQPDEQMELQKKSILRSKLITICKKLQPQFDKEDFKIQYARKNKDFIRKNIQKILPLVTNFPIDDAAWIGKANTKDDKDIKKQSKNCDPQISDFIAQWIKRVDNNRAKRQEDGVERQRRLKKCHFCFNTWNIYYGFDGICLECSQKLGKQKQKNQ